MTFSNTLIKASAGSGKTFQLSNRYLQLIFSGVAPETILATTFTRKAAGEILNRILQRLAKAAFDETERYNLSQFVLTGEREGNVLSQEEVLTTLTKLVRNIHRLRVSTLDSFFQQIAGNLSLELGMPAGWFIMEEDDRSPLLLEGIRGLLEQLGKDKTIELMHLLFKGESRSTITREINSLLTDLAAVYGESTPDAWWQMQHRAKQLPADEIERLVDLLAKADIAKTQKGEPHKSMLNARNKDLSTMRDAMTTGQEIPWEKIGTAGLCLKVVDGTYNYSRADMPQSLIDVYDEIVYQVCATVIHRLATQTEAMGELLGKLTAIVDALKNRRRLFDFSDITNRLSQASLDTQFRQISHRINANTRHLLLDEFQDTSPNQWRVLRPFAERIMKAGMERSAMTEYTAPSFFCVGDVKQAIYGWRGGVAAIFDAIENDLGKLHEEHLDKSYRSCPVVIHAVNRVFGNIGNNAALNGDTNDLSQIEAADRWAKRFELHETSRDNLPGYYSLRTSKLPEQQYNENGEPLKPTQEDRELAHLCYVIDEIIARHRQSPTATIGVLTRTNKMVQRIIFGLRSVGIEASEEGGNPLDQSPAVELILSALSLADYPGNRVACYHLAHSPLGAMLGITPGNYRHETAMQDVSFHIRERLMLEGYSPVLHDWVTQIATVCDERDLGRMIQLLELASTWQKRARIRTMPFINLVRAKHVESPSTSPIRVMSIHKSKGLEFDIVVLPELEAKLTGSKTPKVVTGREESPTSPVSAVLAYPAKEVRPYLPDRFKQLVAQSETERIEESLCVLYVAMTRAVHELLMILMPKEESASAKKSGDNDASASFPKTLAGVLHAGFAPHESLAVEKAVLYQNGDRNWAAKLLDGGRPLSEWSRCRSESDNSPVLAEPDVTIQLAAKSKKTSKNLTRRTPSGQEGTGGTIFPQVTTGRPRKDRAQEIRARGVSQCQQGHSLTLRALTDTPRHSPQAWGTAIHACFEQVTWLEHGLPDRKKLLDIVTPIMQDADVAAKVVDAFYASCKLPEVQTALSLNSTPSPLTPHPSYREVQNERRFWATPEPGVLLQGSIDRLVLVYDNSGPKPRVIGADVIDYKSDHVENEEALNSRVAYYAPQLAEYRKAVAAMYSLANEQITTRLLFTGAGKNVTV